MLLSPIIDQPHLKDWKPKLPFGMSVNSNITSVPSWKLMEFYLFYRYISKLSLLP